MKEFIYMYYSRVQLNRIILFNNSYKLKRAHFDSMILPCVRYVVIVPNYDKNIKL
jgi:hypothetical protein